jgi:hypothetical protein
LFLLPWSAQFHSHLFGDEQWILAPLKVLEER